MVARRVLVLLVTVSLGHILLISAQVQSKSGLPVIEAVAFDLFARVQRLTGGIADTGSSIWSHYFALSGAAKENEELRRRILELEGQVQQQRAVVDQTRTLERLLAVREEFSGPMVAARVTAGNPAPGALTVTIDRGTADGVSADLAVLGTRGVVGRVIGPVSAHAALVQLLIGRNAAAAVVFERSGAGGMMVGGSADGMLRGEYVPILADIQAGERVTTSGQDGIYPPGFLVGTVERVSRSGIDREIVVRPATDFSSIDLVLVSLSRPASLGGGS